MDNRLNVIATDNQAKSQGSTSTRQSRRQEAEAYFDRLWLTNPQKYNPERNAIGRQRLNRTFQLIRSKIDLTQKNVVDLGCGNGAFCHMLSNAGAKVEAVDISNNALKAVQKNCPQAKPKQDFIPYTSLNDSSFDLVVSLELIGDLPPKEHRLYFSELARLVKNDGYVVGSTSIDIGTEGALQVFGALAETEFTILKWVFSYNALSIHILDFFKAPERLSRAWKDGTYRKQQLGKRRNLGKIWFKWNSSQVLGPFWKVLSFVTHPISKRLEQSGWLLNFLEKICRPLWGESGISHMIFLGQIRPLVPPTSEELQANEPKQKRHVWE